MERKVGGGGGVTISLRFVSQMTVLSYQCKIRTLYLFFAFIFLYGLKHHFPLYQLDDQNTLDLKTHLFFFCRA